MKKKILNLLLMGMMLMTLLTGCQSVAKSMGGSMTLKLESNQNLLINVKQFLKKIGS